jgi:hypothetical protein
MGQPTHYALELADRCQSLITQLWPKVSEGLSDDGRFSGPLTTTFLLGMATPMLLLPLERMDSGSPYRVANDEVLAPKIAAAFRAELHKRIKDSLFANFDWRYTDNVDAFNISDGFDADLCQELRDDAARIAAREKSLECILRIMRNGLAHGGIVYLDGDGWQSNGSAEMLAFVRSHGPNRRRGLEKRYSVVRLAEDDLRSFLANWCEWLQKVGIADALAA